MTERGIRLLGEWSDAELQGLSRMLKPLPKHWLEDNQSLECIARRPKLMDAPPGAPGHSKYDPSSRTIVVYDKGVYHHGRIDPEQFRRSVLHELGHSILEDDASILDRWSNETKGDGFVDEYAKTSPAEDFCDTFSEFLIFHEKTKQVVPRKWRFLYNLMQQARPQEKVAMNFINAFNDELTKVAASPKAWSGIANMARRFLSSGAGKGALAVGAGAIGGGALGLAKGKRSGYDSGTEDVGAVAQKALQIGRQQGAQIGYQYAMQQLKNKGK